MRQALVVFGILFLSALAHSAIIYVPDDHPTIQGAIDASQFGDTVIVRPGTYVENIDFSGKPVTVQSEQGAEVTIIDGQNPSDPTKGSVVTFASQETALSKLEGFTLINGTGSLDPLIGLYWGGGIFCYKSSPWIAECIIKNNVAEDPANQDGLGGGIGCIDCGGIIISNAIHNNSAVDGGGIVCIVHTGDSPTILNNEIYLNQAESGGAIRTDDASPLIVGNLIHSNSAEWGGGIDMDNNSSGTSVMSNLISNNNATTGGGGIGIGDCSPNVENNIIVGNTSQIVGGAVACSASNVVLENNTIVGNAAVNSGGALSADETSDVTVVNSVLWDNSAPSGPEIYIGNWASSTSSVTVSHCDVDGGQSLVHVSSGCTLNWGAGNIDDDPLFADGANDDYHLTWSSPCRDVGDNNAVTTSMDYEGNPRTALGTVDMGADEYYYSLYYMGDVVPGSTFTIKVVGYPTAPITLAFSSALANFPLNTPHGDLWLQWPPAWSGPIGSVPGNGVLDFTATAPAGWIAGDIKYLQALVGPWGASLTRLTDPAALIVE